MRHNKAINSGSEKRLTLEVLMCHLVLIALAALSSGCTTTPNQITPIGQSVIGSRDISCPYIPAHFKSDGSYIDGAYNCPSSSSRSSYAENQCNWIDGYLKKDGAYINGYNRCKYNLSPTLAGSENPTTNAAPCVTGYCGSVNVKGYYRKDGTYVRPHTRSKGK